MRMRTSTSGSAGTFVFDFSTEFNLVHRPLSDLLVVYNEVRPEDARAARAFTLEYTHRIGF